MEAAASGISAEDVTELESFIEEITEREKTYEAPSETATKKSDAEILLAAEMRQEAMERFSQTKKRSPNVGEGDQEKKDKRTRSVLPSRVRRVQYES